ncbi:MAG: hypothetical protein WBA63_15850 [Thermomicrobiales bacterium]
MTVPHDPFSTANARSGTNAFPVVNDNDRHADALDTWLNRHSATLRTGDTPSPAEPQPPSGSQNGAIDRADEAATATHPALVASAERFHRRLETAERTTAPEVPEDAIWEKIMSSHLALEPTPGPHRPALSSGVRNTDTPPRPLRTIVGSHPALSVVLAAALVVAMIALFRGISDHGNVAAPIDPMGTGSAHLAAIASPSPVASGTAAAGQCEVRVLTEDEAAQIVREWQAAPPPQYVPIQGPAPASDAETASKTYIRFMACRSPRDVPRYLLVNSLMTTRGLFRENQAQHLDAYIDQLERELDASRELSSVLIKDNESFIVDANDPEVKPYVAYNSAGNAYAILPQDFVVLVDGRIGAPLKTAETRRLGAATPENPVRLQTVPFGIFAQEHGEWLLDEVVTLCAMNCDQYYAGLQAKIDALRHPRDASPSPAITSTASPVAADPWLQPIAADECAPVTASGESDADAVATTARHFLACGRYGSLPDAMLPFLSPGFLAQHPELASGQFTVTTTEVEDAKAISAILIAQGDYTPYVKGLPGADDETDVTQGFYEVFLPESAILLDDGRIGIPLKIAFGSDDALNAATQRTDSGAPMTVAMYVFTPADGTWQVDQQLLLCLENCESFWEGQLEHAGTPYPSDEAVATAAASATAESAWLRPITADECVLPTQAAMADPQLPDRVYRPLLKPTTAHAEEVARTARNITACVIGEPNHSPNIAARFMTERMKSRYVNRDEQIGDMLPEDIEAAQTVSAQIEDRGAPTIYQRAPEGVHDEGPDTWPGTVGDSTPGWFSTYKPENAIQFTDGRIGVITTVSITSDDLWKRVEGDDYSEVPLLIFSSVDGQWKLDQTLDLCFGECEAYWQERQDQLATPASPIPTTVSASTAPQPCITLITDDDISRLITESTTWPDPAYVPTQGPATSADAHEAITTYLANSSCRFLDEKPYKYQARTLQTDRANLASSLAYTSTADYADMLATSNELSKELSPLLLDLDPAAYIVDERDLAGTDAVVLSEWNADGMQQVIFPEDFVTLADGRIGVPVKSILASSQRDGETPAFIPVRFLTFAKVAGQWLVDESLTLCSGACAPFYEEIGRYIDTVRLAPATPAPSVATPAPDTATAAQMPRDTEPAGMRGEPARAAHRTRPLPDADLL